jgi:hypothetical protein
MTTLGPEPSDSSTPLLGRISLALEHIMGYQSCGLMSDSKSSGNEWRKLARKASGKINTAWWLEKLAVPLVISALIASCLILMARRELPQFPWAETMFIGLILLLGMGLMAWGLARRNFETPEQALVRMEASMKMRNALSAAKQGVSPWPPLPPKVDDGTRWRWSRLATPLLAAALSITASALLPVTARTDPNAVGRDEPQAWKDLEADLEALAEDATVQEQYLEELEKRLEELRKQNENEWYSHSSMEATDALQKMHGAELESLNRNLLQAEHALRSLQKNGGKMSEAGRQRMLNKFEEAMQGLQQGTMKPNQGLLDQLKELDPKNLGPLNQEQLDQLRENLKRQAQNCEQGQGQGQGQGKADDWLDEMLNEGNDAPGEEGDPNRQGADNGGINRGPGTAPGVLGRISEDLTPGDLKGLESRDLSKSLPGDLLELADGKHEIDKTKIGLRDGGGIQGEGRGGDRVWKDSLLPAEKKALKEFFQ